MAEAKVSYVKRELSFPPSMEEEDFVSCPMFESPTEICSENSSEDETRNVSGNSSSDVSESSPTLGDDQIAEGYLFEYPVEETVPCIANSTFPSDEPMECVTDFVMEKLGINAGVPSPDSPNVCSVDPSSEAKSPNPSTPDGPLLRSVSLASELSGAAVDGSWKKTIQLGPNFQATVPEGLSDCEVSTHEEERLLWDPKVLLDHEVEGYLREIQEMCFGREQGVAAIPVGNHIRDDEQELFLLMQCKHNVKEALLRRGTQPLRRVDTLSLWSEEECRNFESGLKMYGKDFYLIQRNKLRGRSVGEIVHFYYLWKKTERHDVFVAKNKIGKKKCSVQMGTMRLHG